MAGAVLRLLPLHRVSTLEQARGAMGEGLDRQRASTRAVALAHGAVLLPAVEVVDVSGSDLDKTPEWAQVLDVVRDAGTHLVADAIDRVLRAESFNFKVFQDLIASGTRIFTPGRVYDLSAPEDGFLGGLMALLGGRERAEIKRRALAGREAARRRGEWPLKDAALPRGCLYDRVARRWTYTADADVIRSVFRMFVAENRTMGEIGRTIGKPIQTVRLYLQNPIYRGLLRFDERRGELYESRDGRQADRKKVARPPEEVVEVRVYGGQDQEPQIVEDHIWFSAQSRLERNSADHVRRRAEGAPEGWASGFLRSRVGPEVPAGIVTFQMGGEGDPWAGPAHALYLNGGQKNGRRYACRCRMSWADGTPAKCTFGSPIASRVNANLDRYLTMLTTDPAFLDGVRTALRDRSETDPAEGARKVLQDRLDGLDDRETRITDLYLDGRLDRARHDARQDEIRRERETIRRELSALGSPPPRPTEEDLDELARTWAWSSAWAPEQKRAWMARHVVHIMVSDEAIEGALVRVPAGGGEGMPVYVPGSRQAWDPPLYSRARRSRS